MPCYVQKSSAPTRDEYRVWKDIGYLGTWEQYCDVKARGVGQTMFVCGDLGAHCADCSAVGDFLCDFPVGPGQTCDRPMCGEHAREIGPELHYCATHYAMWQEFKDNGGVAESLRNVVAFKPEK